MDLLIQPSPWMAFHRKKEDETLSLLLFSLDILIKHELALYKATATWKTTHQKPKLISP